jgi:hypothetical protein
MKNMTKEHTLIVYSNQETVDFFMIPNEKISIEQLSLLLEAEGKWINCHETNPGMQFLSNALSTKKEYCFEGDPKDYCIFSKFKVKSGSLRNGCAPVTRVISSGFWL